VPKELNVSASSLEDISDDDLLDTLEAVRRLISLQRRRPFLPGQSEKHLSQRSCPSSDLPIRSRRLPHSRWLAARPAGAWIVHRASAFLVAAA
jgi:hypothetical protein